MSHFLTVLSVVRLRFRELLLGIFSVILSTLGLAAFELEGTEIDIALAPEFDHLPVHVGVDGLSGNAQMTVSSNAGWVSGRFEGEAAQIILSFATAGLIFNRHDAVVTVSDGEREEEILIRAFMVPLNIVRLVDDPYRQRTYGIHQDGDRLGAMVIFDPHHERNIGSITIGRRPSDLTIDAEGEEMLVICGLSRQVHAIDLTTLLVSETIELPVYEGSVLNTGRVGVGPGNVIYYTDAAWLPALRVLDRASGEILQTVFAEGSTGFGIGDFVISPDQKHLYSWARHEGNAFSYLSRFAVAADGTLTFQERTVSGGLERRPFDSPALISADGQVAVIKHLAVNASAIQETLMRLPSTAYSISPNAELVATETAIYHLQTEQLVYSLPKPSPVQAMTWDYQRLVYFDSTAKRLRTVNLAAEIGARVLERTVFPEDGSFIFASETLEWAAVPNGAFFNVYLSTSREELAAADPDSAAFIGSVSGSTMALPENLLAGQTYYWRVDPVTSHGPMRGEIFSFTVSSILTSPTSINAATVTGHASQVASLHLASSEAGTGWSASTDEPWVTLEQPSGATPATLTVHFHAEQAGEGLHHANLFVEHEGERRVVPLSFVVEALQLTHLQSDPESERVYAISEATDDAVQAYLLEIDSASEEITRVLPVGRSVTDLALHTKDGRIYVPNWMDGVLRAVDRESFREVQTYAFAPFTGPGSINDVYRVTPGAAGRLIIEEADQMIRMQLLDTNTGDILSTSSTVRQGGGAADPTGRYYYHGESGSTDARLRRFDMAGDSFDALGSVRVTTAGQLGSEVVVVSGDGSRIFWNGSVFLPSLAEEWPLGSVVYSTSNDGSLAFGNAFIFDVIEKRTVFGMPRNTTVSAFNSTTGKLVLQDGERIRFYRPFFPEAMPAPELSVAGVTTSAVDIAWTDESLETGFSLQWRPVGSGIWNNVNLVRNVTTRRIGNLPSNTSYEFRVRGNAPAGNSDWSDTVVARTLALPPQGDLLGFPLVQSPYSILLTWSVRGEYASVILERRQAGQDEWVFVAEVEPGSDTYLDIGLTPGTPYSYRMWIVREGFAPGSGGTSSLVATFHLTAPNPPSPVVFSQSATSLLIRWDPDPAAEGYQLDYRAAGETEWQLLGIFDAATTSYLHTPLVTGKTYEYRLNAWNSFGRSDFELAHGTPRELVTLLWDEFEPNENSRMWYRIQGGTAVDGGAGFDTGGALWFGGSVSFAETMAVDVREGGFLRFSVRAGNEYWDGRDYWTNFRIARNINLQYSLDGTAWTTLQSISVGFPHLREWADFIVAIPPAAWSATTRFRWAQSLNTTAGNWALDNVEILGAEPAPVPAVAYVVPSVVDSTTVHLSWPSPNPTGITGQIRPDGVYLFTIERRLAGEGWQVIGLADGGSFPTFTDDAAPAASTLFYRVRTLTTWAESLPSPVGMATTPSQLGEWQWTELGLAGNATDLALDDFGVANIQRYAFGLPSGTIPRAYEEGSGVGGMPAVRLDPKIGHLRVTFMRRAPETNPEIEYRVEFSADLFEWLPVPLPVEVIDLTGVWEEVTFEQEALSQLQGRGFFRVRILREE